MRGCERIVQAGGRVLVQDESSSVVWGMPGQVAASRTGRRVFPLDRLADEIRRSGRTTLPGAHAHRSRMDCEAVPHVDESGESGFIRSLVAQRAAIILDAARATVQARLLPLARQIGSAEYR